jgi:ribose transport system permease protein
VVDTAAAERKERVPASATRLVSVVRPRAARALRGSGSGILLALVLLLVAGTLLSDRFMTMSNMENLSRQIAIVGVLGIGMTFVILTGGIDLSVGSILGCVAVLFAVLLKGGMPWTLAALVGLAAGAAIGALNGLGVTKGALPPFIMTLAMMVIARGTVMTYADGQPISVGTKPAAAIAWLDAGHVFGVPVPFVLLLGVAGLAGFLLHYTPYGRRVYAVGDNVEAARLSGISTGRVLFSVYAISGLCAALGALILVSRVATGLPKSGEFMELDAIAIVVIGGSSLFGGEGGVRGTLIGAAIVGVVANIMNQLHITLHARPIPLGLIILGAVLIERHGRGRARGG